MLKLYQNKAQNTLKNRLIMQFFMALKEAVWHWWTLHLQDHENFFEDQIAAYIEECRQERRIDAMCEEAA